MTSGEQQHSASMSSVAVATGTTATYHNPGSRTRLSELLLAIQLFSRIMKRFRGGLVFKAQRLLYHSILGSRVMKKKGSGGTSGEPQHRASISSVAVACTTPLFASSLSIYIYKYKYEYIYKHIYICIKMNIYVYICMYLCIFICNEKYVYGAEAERPAASRSTGRSCPRWRWRPVSRVTGTSLIRNTPPVGPCSRPMRRVLGGSQGGGGFS
jgi:hypothetical protein